MRLGLDRGQELVQRGVLHRFAVDRGRGADERGLEVVELELRRLADDLRGCLRVLDAGEVDDDLIGPLLADLGLAHAELVDAAPHDVDGAVEVGGRELLVRRRNGLQRHLQPALEIEAERRFLVDRGARDREQRDRDEGRDEERDDVEGRATVHGRAVRLAVVI